MEYEAQAKERSHTRKRWSDEEVKVLIILYQQKELLYNAQHPDYTNREKRLHAYDEITERLRYMRKTITTEEVKAKIELLRRQFLVELNKIQSAYYSGRSAPSVWWFNSMKFIQSHLKRRNTDGVEATTPEEECEPEPEPEYTEFPHTNGISVSKRIVQKKLLKTPSPPPYIENGYSPIPGPSSSPEEQGVRYVPMSEGSFESRSSSPRNVVSTSGPKKPKLSRKELRYQTDAALLQFLEQASDNSAKKTTEQAFGEFIANELEKIQCIDIREEVKWEIQLAIRKGIQQALQTNTHSSLCTVPPNQMEMESPSKEYFIINNVE
ncbi:uncharacterized protein LOC119656228 isoform X2 [Hermetia illucens]|uniref:uncharacterized protein LOC119656228 isoform X2 n=1 Tax=Hermetia illucens TaxID=343691 RepID=UPI0018CC59F7|nr:uncharacterized protein LOC119656228 isoform X2 [Hermetia illucens]